MNNLTLPVNSSRIKTCEYKNCKNQFKVRSNNHKYCKEHEKVNNRKDKLKSKKRKYRGENDLIDTSIEKENNKKSNLNELKSIKKEFEEIKSVKKEITESQIKSEQNTPALISKKPNLLDILIKRTSSETYKCIGKNKPFHNNHIPQKVDKCIQTDDLFEFIPKIKKTKVDKKVGTEEDITLEPTFSSLDTVTMQQFSSMLDTPTKNIQSITSPISIKRSIRNIPEYPLRDISNTINCKYLKSPISDKKSPKFLSKPFRLPEYDNKNKENKENKENYNFNTTPRKRQLNPSISYRNDIMPFLSSEIPEEEIPNFENKQKDIYNPSLLNKNDNNNNDNNGNCSSSGSSGSGSGSVGLDYENESNSNSYSLPVDYYMEYIKILKKISKFSPSQELKQTLSSNSNLTSINNHILSPAKTDAEDLLNWLNTE